MKAVGEPGFENAHFLVQKPYFMRMEFLDLDCLGQQ